jgi:hypothetical protein
MVGLELECRGGGDKSDGPGRMGCRFTLARILWLVVLEDEYWTYRSGPRTEAGCADAFLVYAYKRGRHEITNAQTTGLHRRSL